MKILLTGASGLVGAEVARQAADAGHTIIGLTGKWRGTVPGATELHAANLSDPIQAAYWVRRAQPDAVINAAAISEPLACEADAVMSQAMNVALPAGLAEACHAHRARFIHISSEQVFDGNAAPYSIRSAPCPINLYGRQKVESEQRVLEANASSATVRAPLLLGNSLSGRRSVHEKLLELWSGGGVARLYMDEFRQVCTAENLAAALLELAEKRELAGVYHWAGSELGSRYTLAQKIAKHFGIAESQVAAVTRADTPAISAKRPANLALDLAPLDRVLRTKPQTVEAALGQLAVPEAFREWQRKLASPPQP